MKYIAASMAAASAIQVKSKNLAETTDEVISGTINVDGMDVDWSLDVDYGFEYDNNNDWADYSSESVSNNSFLRH